MSAQSVHGHSFLSWFRIPSKAERMERRLAKIGHRPTNWSQNQNLPINWRYQHAVPHFAPVVLPLRQQQTDAMTPIPATRNTDGIPQLPRLPMPRDNREVIAELETSKCLPGLPRWVADLRNNPPVSASKPASAVTVREINADVDAGLARVNSVRLAPVEILHLDPLAREANASTDKTGSGQVAEDDAWLNGGAVEMPAFEAFTALAPKPGPDDTVKVAACDRKQMMKMQAQQKESE